MKYPPGYDPWRLSLDALCDHWAEWRGMQRVVDEEHAKERAAAGGGAR